MRVHTYPDKAVMKVHADQCRSDAGVVGERGRHGLLHDGLGGGARPVVEADVEAGGSGREKRRQDGGEAQAVPLRRRHGCMCRARPVAALLVWTLMHGLVRHGGVL